MDVVKGRPGYSFKEGALGVLNSAVDEVIDVNVFAVKIG